MLDLDSLEELLLGGRCTPEQICAELAKIFSVKCTEVGLLRVEGQLLRFLYPAELQAAGCIPLSSSAVAAKTALTKQAELFNNFANIPHRSVFELIRLSGPGSGSAGDAPLTIQKLMSAPILGEDGEVLGVVQVSRKGATPGAAGPDFAASDLIKLESVARRVATLMPEILHADAKSPHRKLEFCNEQKQKPKPSRPR
jgi:hypothetical protein